MKNLVISLTIAASTITMPLFPSLAQVGPGNMGGASGVSVANVCTREINGRLNIRTGPGQNYRPIVEVSNGTNLQLGNSIRGNDGFIWHQVYFSNISGWVRGDYLCGNGNTRLVIGGERPPSVYICTHDGNGLLNLRTGAGQQYRIITQATNGSYVEPLNIIQGYDGFLWHQVRYGNYVGWVRGDYLCGN